MIDFGFGVVLDTINSVDLPELRVWRNDREVMRWCRQSDLITENDHSEWYFRQQSDPAIKMYAIKNHGLKNSLLVGACGLTSLDLLNRRAEFSCYIGPEHQRQSFARQALLTLFFHGFKNLGLRSIWGETFADNPAEELFEKIGMKKDGIRRDFYFKDGKFINATLYSVLDKEWFQRWGT